MKQAVRAGIISSGSKYSLGSPLDGFAFLGKPHLDCIFRNPACCVFREKQAGGPLHISRIFQAGKDGQTYLFYMSVLLHRRDGGFCFLSWSAWCFLHPCCVWLYFCSGFLWQGFSSRSGALQSLLL